MPTSAIGNKRATRGFTLVEVLVAVAVIGLVSAAVVLTLPWGGGHAEDEARRLSARVMLAAQDSILDGAPRGLAVDAHGYRFLRYAKGRWQEVEGRDELAPARWAAGVRVTGLTPAETEETSAPAVSAPAVIFSPTGLMTPFSIDVADAAARFTITGQATGSVATVRHDE